MSLFEVPPESKKAFMQFAALPDATFATFMTVLQETPVLLFPRRRIERALERIDPALSEELMDMVDQLLRLMTTRNSFRASDATITDEDIVKNVLDQMSSPDDPPVLDKALTETLRNRLVEFFEIHSIETSSRATMLAADDPTFSYGEVITDVRPVFNIAGDSIEATFIVHRLTVDFFKDDAEESLTLSMDEEEVDDLIDVLQDAKRRAELIRRSYRGEAPLLEIGQY
jgi:hypothetical protein